MRTKPSCLIYFNHNSSWDGVACIHSIHLLTNNRSCWPVWHSEYPVFTIAFKFDSASAKWNSVWPDKEVPNEQ